MTEHRFARMNEDFSLTYHDDVLVWAADNRWHKSTLVEVGEMVCNVSTVFLGLNHGFSGADMWFETMTFYSDDTGSDQERYTTYAEALAGHDKWVDHVTDDLGKRHASLLIKKATEEAAKTVKVDALKFRTRKLEV